MAGSEPLTPRLTSRPCRRLLLLSLALTLLAAVPVVPLGSTPAAAAVLAPGLQDSIVIKGLETPTALRFAPDGRIFVAEKRGSVKVFSDATDTSATIVADLSPKVHDFADRGLLGLAVPPDPQADPGIYVLYTVDGSAGTPTPRWNDDCPTPPGPDTDGCMVMGRLSRLPLNGDVAGPEQVLLEGWCQQFSSHSVGSLVFDSTGALIVSGGDGASFGGVDYGQYGGTYAGDQANPCGDPPGGAGTALTPPTAEGGALRSQSLGRLNGPTLLNGSVLRLDPRTGAAAAGNPFAGSADAVRARVIATGMRNPFRITVRPGTSEVWLGDVGWNSTEEINRITSTTDEIVENFGWPCYEGRTPQPGYQGAGLNACQRLYDRPGSVTLPHLAFAHADAVVPGDGCPPGGSSVSGVAFNTGSRYPGLEGALFFADYGRNCIWAMKLGADGDPDPASLMLIESQATGPVDLQLGPDGWLYYVGIYDGSIHRIDTAVTSGTTYLSSIPWTSATNGYGPVELDSSSGGPAQGDGGPLTIGGQVYARGLGAHAFSQVEYRVPAGCTSFAAFVGVDDSQGANGSVGFSVLVDGVQRFSSGVLRNSDAPGAVSVPVSGGAILRLHVDDGGDGASWDHADWGDAKLLCGGTTEPPPPGPVTNRPPTIEVQSPSAGTTWSVAQGISFAASALDPESGPLPASALSWRLNHQHCPDTCHTHVVQEWKGTASGGFTTGDIDYPGWYELVVTATDDQGATATTTVRLDPRTVVLTFTTSPGGLKLGGLVVGSGSGATPFSRTVIVGSANTVSAPSPQVVKNRTYHFVSWSDRLPQSHTIIAPSTSTTYTATYRQK